MRTHAALLVVVVFALVSGVHGQTATVRVSGRAMDSSGAGLPGVEVTLTGPATRSAVTDPDGRYLFVDVTPGAYTMSATLSGFQADTRTIAATAPGSLAVDIVLHPCLAEVLVVDDGLPANLTAADAVLHVRIEDAGRPVRLNGEVACIDGYRHAATVLDIVKAPRLLSDKIQLLRAGLRYQQGDEFIVFLQRHPSGVFVDFGLYTFPVKSGAVGWTRSELPGVTEGSPLRQVLDGLRGALFMVR